MFGCLSYETDRISNQINLLLIHFETKLKELVQIRDDLHEDIVFQYLDDGLRSKAISHIKISRDIYSTGNIEPTIHHSPLRSTGIHLLRLRYLDLNKLLEIFIHYFDDFPETQMIVLGYVLLRVEINLQQEI